MIPTYVSSIWPMVAPALGNHLWQSTFCLVVAGLLTLVFRKNHARVRYGLWLAASIKFLIPFSLLIILGNNLAKPRVIYQTETGFMTAMQEASQPFARPVVHGPSPVAFSPTPPSILPAILAAIWLCGFAAVLILWFVRWRRIRSIVRQAARVCDGRELLALRRVERWAGVRKPIEFVSSQATLEPGIFGIFSPVLIWPRGISPKLEDAHLEAILAHEVWHVRRRDNLASAIHMLVEAIFWFHPMVWWLGSRLVEERERACDEEVLQLGSKPNIYAEGILKTCEFCVESPLACVSGITGADLKKRIVLIMTERAAARLSFRQKLFLAAAGLAAVASPMIFGAASGPAMIAQSAPAVGGKQPSFEVAAIKQEHSSEPGTHISIHNRLGRFSASGVTVKTLIEFAYNVQSFQVSGGPGWTGSDKYEVEAKVEDASVEEMEKLSPEQRHEQLCLRVQSLLANRFMLRLNHQTKELPVYALVVAKSGPKLHEAIPGDTYPNGYKGPDGRSHPGMDSEERGEVTAQAVAMEQFARYLSRQLDRTVVDRTGLAGKYDFKLKWSPVENQRARFNGAEGADADSVTMPNSGPSIFTALQEQLGLKLESTKGPVEVNVIDHIERPSEN